MRSLYQIAVELTMVNHAGGMLSTIAHQFIGIHHHINAATAASNRFRTALIGAGTALVSGGLLTGMAQLVNHGAEFARVIDRMRLAGWSPGDIAHSTDRAFELARQYPSLPASFLAEMQREMAPVLGSREEAQHLAGNLAQLMRVLEIQRGPGHTHALHQEVIAAVRAGEVSANTLTDARFREFLDLMVPSINAWGGLVTPRDLAQFFQYARQSGIGLSDRFIRDVAPTLIQEMRASSSGTAFQTLMQAMVGGRMRLRALNAWNDLGLLDRNLLDPNNLTPEGRLRRVQAGVIIRNDLLRSDPDKWAHEVLVPALIRAGRMTQAGYEQVLAGNLRTGEGAKAREAIQLALYQLLGDRTGQGLMGTLIEQIRKITRDAGLVGEAKRLAEAQELINENYGMALANVKGSWQTLNEALALPNMQTATEGLKRISNVLGTITATVRSMDPSTINSIFIGMGVGLATLLTLSLGAIVVAVAGWPIIIGAAVLGALAGAAAWVYQNWEHHKEAFAGIWRDLVGALRPIIELGTPVVEVFRSITGAIERFIAYVRSLIPGLSAPSAPPGGFEAPGFTPIPPAGSPGGMLQPQSWVPSAGQPSLVPVRNEITLDGHKLGEAVGHYIAHSAMHVQSAAQYDGAMGHVPVDMAMA